jgi:uncharacterized protein YndB with AHSA1/START domain
MWTSLFGRKKETVGGTKDLLFLSRTVDLPAERAFALFVDAFNSWWPRDATWGKEKLDLIGIESRIGGRCFEKSRDGTIAVWGKVLTLDRPRHIVFTWQIRPDRSAEEEENQASRVDVRFVEGDGKKTEVVVVHRDFFRHGDGFEAYRQEMAGKRGWPTFMGCYVKAAETAGRA